MKHLLEIYQRQHRSHRIRTIMIRRDRSGFGYQQMQQGQLQDLSQENQEIIYG